MMQKLLMALVKGYRLLLSPWHLLGLQFASPGAIWRCRWQLHDRAPLAALPSLVRGRARPCAGASAALVQPLAVPFRTFRLL